MRGVHLFIVLVTLPLLAGLGFDAYLWYLHQDKPFEFATPGYIWTQNDPDSYKWTVENAPPEVWMWINYALGQKSVVVGSAFAGFFYAILLILKILGVWPFKNETIVYGSGSRTDEILGKKATKVKYKRK